MKLSQLVANALPIPAQWDIEFDQIATDSRTLEKGDLFIALPGEHGHGEQHLSSAIERGAVAVIVDGEAKFHTETSAYYEQVPVFYANNAAACFPQWVQNRYDIKDMPLVAVTGTNGKSSVTQYIAQLAQHCGEASAVFGTLGNGRWPNLAATKNTTSDLLTLVRQLHELKQADTQPPLKLASLEVSSHGLVQNRVAGLAFSTAVMTNLSQDHLDYHGDMDSYFAAKQQLFSDHSIQNALINIDDQYGQALAGDPAVQGQVMTYGTNANAQVRCQLLAMDSAGMHGQLSTPWGDAPIVLPLLGEFNLVNVTAAIAVLALQGMDFKQLCQAAETLQPVSGRMEVYSKAGAPTVVVDFAHTPEALRNVLKAMQPWQAGITTVFGCGGDRDRGKRPLMTAVAQELSEQVWLTNDNPRYEDPAQIIADALAACQESKVQATPKVEYDRASAIKQAIAATAPENVVLIAGKGHEAHQEIKGEKIPYNDAQLLVAQGYQRLGGGHD